MDYVPYGNTDQWSFTGLEDNKDWLWSWRLLTGVDQLSLILFHFFPIHSFDSFGAKVMTRFYYTRALL